MTKTPQYFIFKLGAVNHLALLFFELIKNLASASKLHKYALLKINCCFAHSPFSLFILQQTTKSPLK
jgi:hypothetical protein